MVIGIDLLHYLMQYQIVFFKFLNFLRKEKNNKK